MAYERSLSVNERSLSVNDCRKFFIPDSPDDKSKHYSALLVNASNVPASLLGGAQYYHPIGPRAIRADAEPLSNLTEVACHEPEGLLSIPGPGNDAVAIYESLDLAPDFIGSRRADPGIGTRLAPPIPSGRSESGAAFSSEPARACPYTALCWLLPTGVGSSPVCLLRPRLVL